MTNKKTKIKDEILRAALPDVPFDGWSWAVLVKAAERAGYKRADVRKAFPGGMGDVLGHFADWVDREMLARLERIDPEVLKIRERIRTAVLTRFDVLEPYKDAERYAALYWAMPLRHISAGQIIWRTADRIWDWAGDDSQDYNRYTKRGLLSGILSSTTLVWLNDDSDDMHRTRQFLGRRIENVMQLGRLIGKIKKAA